MKLERKERKLEARPPDAIIPARAAESRGWSLAWIDSLIARGRLAVWRDEDNRPYLSAAEVEAYTAGKPGRPPATGEAESSGEKQSSIRDNSPDSAGATPAPATNSDAGGEGEA